MQLFLNPVEKSCPLYLLATANWINSKEENIKLHFSLQPTAAKLMDGSSSITEPLDILNRLGESFNLFGKNEEEKKEVDLWLADAIKLFSTKDFNQLKNSFAKLDSHLKIKSFIVGYQVTLADIMLFCLISEVAIWARYRKDGKESELGIEVSRWWNYLNTFKALSEASSQLKQEGNQLKGKKKDQGKFEIGLDESWKGKVVTRFPPEPSGYLHIGHAKAVMLNQYFAQEYDGKMLIRFDDTNPSKEKQEFEDSILEDLALLDITGCKVSHTSDFFDKILEFAEKLIKNGDAYCDNTPKERMSEERYNGIPSKNRDLSVEENLSLFEEMKLGSKSGLEYCLRAKMSVDNPNKALRDPVIFRCNLTPHQQTGTKYKLYPTYDFACPIVDSLEGVTHTLRTNEYHDRNPQFYWFIEKLGLRKPIIWDYGKVNFIYTLLSKRKLAWFVEQGLVTGWDDPRMPTVRGIRRRGLTVEALREYILMQGASQATVKLEWDKLWSLNKRIIDPIVPRYSALESSNLCKVKVLGMTENYTKKVPKHKKNPDCGEKSVVYSANLYLEQSDVKDLVFDEEVTFMDWGNMIAKKIEKEDSLVTYVEFEMNLEGDFKKTKKKLTWLSQEITVDLKLLDYDFLISKKELDDGDELKDVLTPVTEFVTDAVGDRNLKELKQGDILQIERKGYFICDSNDENGLKLILIPDGRQKSISSKAEKGKK